MTCSELNRINHFVFFLGYMDISIVPISSPKWQTIAYVPDEYFYAQDHQQNYSAIVVSTRMMNKITTHIIIYNIHGKGKWTEYIRSI